MIDASLPSCYVLGLETQIGLAVVRELGMAGIRVIGIAQAASAIGLKSRYLSEGVVIANVRTAAGVEQIRGLGRRFGPGVLLAVSEVNTDWLIRHRSEFGGITPVVPDAEAFARVLDKHRTLAHAQQLGIEVPRSAQPESWQEVERIAGEFSFPAVLKWSDPAAVAPRLQGAGIALDKAEYVYTAEEFRAAASRYAPIGTWPMIQEYCAGRGLGQFFFMHQGRALRRFQHLRIAEWPPEGGFSSVCDALPLDRFVELQEKSIALLRDIGWEGVAMVEYRLDESTGRAVLMEINGRFWGSYPLAVACGAGFGLLAYHVQGLGADWQPPAPPAADLRCRMVATELKRLVRILLQPGRIRDRHYRRRPLAELWRFASDFLRPRVCYYVWSLRDPLPFLADMRNLVRRGN